MLLSFDLKQSGPQEFFKVRELTHSRGLRTHDGDHWVLYLFLEGHPSTIIHLLEYLSRHHHVYYIYIYRTHNTYVVFASFMHACMAYMDTYAWYDDKPHWGSWHIYLPHLLRHLSFDNDTIVTNWVHYIINAVALLRHEKPNSLIDCLFTL